jgi:hypothetical protein
MLLSKSSLYRSRKFSSLKVTDSVLVAVDGSTARFPPKKLQSLQFSMRFHIIEITNAHRGRKLLHTELRLIAFQRKRKPERYSQSHRKFTLLTHAHQNSCKYIQRWNYKMWYSLFAFDVIVHIWSLTLFSFNTHYVRIPKELVA